MNYLIQACVDLAILGGAYMVLKAGQATIRGIKSLGRRLSRDYQAARMAAWLAARAARREIDDSDW